MGSFLLLFTGCDSSREVVSNIEEKEANVILVLLESKGIPASKLLLLQLQLVAIVAEQNIQLLYQINIRLKPLPISIKMDFQEQKGRLYLISLQSKDS